MKKSVFTLVAIAFLAINSFAQVAINTTGAEPNASAILDLSSNSKGLLIPRMTTNNRTTNVTAVAGLLVFDTDTDSFWYYDGSQSDWVELGSGTNSDWTTSGNNMYSAVSGNVGIGTSIPTTKLQIINGNLSLRSQFADAYIKLQSDEEEDMTPAYIWSENAKGFAVGSTPGSPQLLVNAATGKVGIGTTIPSQKLSIRDGNISLVSEGTDSYIFLGSDELGDAIASYIWTKDNVGFAVGSTEGVPQMVVKNSNGNVGIGTINPSAKLEVAGQIKITGGNPATGKVLTSGNDGEATWISPTVYAASINDLTDARADVANLFLGDETGIINSGNFNTGTGIQALKANTTGLSNTATGFGSLQYNNIGYENTANGHLALQKNTTGNANVAFGKEALLNNTTKSNLTAIGFQSLYYNGTGSTLSTESIENTAIGSKSLYSNTLGSQNTAAGMEALKANTLGSGNSAFGAYSLDSNTDGKQNTAAGAFALTKNTTADGNTAFGYKAAYSILDGNYNSAFGINALYATTSGTYNSAFSFGALFLNQTGDENTAYGYKALYSNVSGNENTAIGSRAGYNALGSGNVFIGRYAGYNEEGSNKLYIANSNTDTPLIYGEFDSDLAVINGHLETTDYISSANDIVAGDDLSAHDDVFVGDDIVVTGDYKYASSKTKILKIPAASFSLYTNQDAERAVYNDYAEWTMDGGHGSGLFDIHAGVNLPEGAVITRFSFYYRTYSDDLYVDLRRKEQFTNFTYQNISEGAILSDSQYTITRNDDTSISYTTIDNDNYFYYIHASLHTWDNGGFVKFYGAEIEYTIDSLE